MNSRVENAVRRGTAFLQAVQLPDGSFESFSSPSKSPLKPRLTYRTVFTPALILSAISQCNDTHARGIRRALATWLLAQKSPHWSFNYWAKASPERQRLPYPDDLDDTFCALLALHSHNPALIDETTLAKVVKLLIATESTVGGPYRTWLAGATAPKVWHDVDLAVNANIAAFLRLTAEPLPNITQMMERAIASRTFRSPYYPSAYPIVYYIARAYDGPLVPELARYLITKRRNGWWGSPLHTALAVTSLVRLGRTDACHEALERLLDSQQADGSWPAEAFCIDPAVQNKTHFSGAAALSTAFAIEALTLLQPKTTKTATPKQTSDPAAEALLCQIEAILQEDTQTLGPVLRHKTRAALKNTQEQDANHEIRLLPYFFNQSLAKPASNAPLAHLGAANLYGWAAYTVYDDFLDGEGDPQVLSAANVAMRYSIQHFQQALPHDAEFQTYRVQMFNAIDNANAWELAHCRAPITGNAITVTELPRYSRTLDLANRSLGHTLPPLAVLASIGIPPSDRRATCIARALRHYIAARQLNDDLHDWQQDLRAGIITYVVAELLCGANIKPSTYKLARLIPDLQRQFWNVTLPFVCQRVARHTALARSNALASGLLTPDNLIHKLTGRIDSVIQKTLQEHSNAQAFLAAYAETTTPSVRTQSSPKSR